MRNFLEICGGQEEACAVLSYLSGCGKAKCLVINKKDIIEELDAGISSVKQVDEVLGSIPAFAAIEDEDDEDKSKMLELEIGAGTVRSPNGKSDGDDLMRVIETSQTAGSLGDTFFKSNP